MHPAARRTRKPGQFLDPATRWMRQPARWKHPIAQLTLHLSYRKHPASRRTWRPTGFSIRRLTGCIRRLAGHGNRPVSLSGCSLDASLLSLEGSSSSPDVETGRFLYPAPHRMDHPSDWMHHPTRRMHPAPRRTRKSASFSSGASPDASTEPLDASPRPPDASGDLLDASSDTPEMRYFKGLPDFGRAWPGKLPASARLEP
jgi:hypothetical protein